MSRRFPGVSRHHNGYRGEFEWTASGKRQRLRTSVFDTAEHAYDELQEMKERHGLAGGRRARKARITVGAFHATWLKLRPRPKPGTHHSYEGEVKAFVDRYPDLAMADVDAPFAREWLLGDGDWSRKWQLSGLRVMFGDAWREGLIPRNPFSNLRLPTSKGRKYLKVLELEEVWKLADVATEVWGERLGAEWRALILLLAFSGPRPAEAYALRATDLDYRNLELRIERQFVWKTLNAEGKIVGSFELPKNGRPRTVALAPVAAEALKALPRTLDADATFFHTRTGKMLHGGNQHYYWQAIRCAFGKPQMELYELRHFCGSYLFNDCGLPDHQVAAQLGHTDGGTLVRELYGHPSDKLAIEAVTAALRGARPPAIGDYRDAARS